MKTSVISKILPAFGMLAIIAVLLAGCGGDDPIKPSKIVVTGVSLNKTALSLTEGTTETLTATVAPENATDKTVSWKSSDAAVATVTDGKVTAMKAGTATITVTTADGGKTATCAVTVTASSVAVTGVTLDKTSLSLQEGATETLTATVAPENATDKTVSWKSSDDAVATVTDGKVTAVKAGTATITVTTADGGKTATCAVTVTAKPAEVTSIAVKPETLELMEGTTQQLEVVVTPADAVTPEFNWLSTNEEVATVDKDGLVTAVKPGKAKIFAKIEGKGIEAACELTVTPDVTLKSIDFTAEKYELELGATLDLSSILIFNPEYAANKDIIWSISDLKVADMLTKGILTAVGYGETELTVISEENNNIRATCTVKVAAPTTGLFWYIDSFNLFHDGHDLGRHILHPCIDPDGNVYYSYHDGTAQELALARNDAFVCSYDTWILNTGSNYAKSSAAAAGGGHYFIPYTTGYNRGLSVKRIKDGEARDFCLQEDVTESYSLELCDQAADRNGNFYAAGSLEDEFGVINAMLWKMSADGTVTTASFANGSKDTEVCAVATSGDDVWCLVYEGYGDGDDYDKHYLAAYRNGERQYLVTDQLTRWSSTCCDLAVVGSDVYALVNEKAGTEKRIAVYKNKELMYVLKQNESISPTQIAVSRTGDVYCAGFDDAGKYIWKNDAVIYTPGAIPWTMFVKD